MSKAHPKKQRPKPKRGLATKRRGRSVVELKPKEAKTHQKTVRVPTHILSWLEGEAAKVRPEPISVPLAIVQILEDAYARAHAPKAANG